MAADFRSRSGHSTMQDWLLDSFTRQCKIGRWTLHDFTHWPPSSFLIDCTSSTVHCQLLLPVATGPAKKEQLHAHQWQFQNYLHSSMISNNYGPIEAIKRRLRRIRKGLDNCLFHKIPLSLRSHAKKPRNSAIFEILSSVIC